MSEFLGSFKPSDAFQGAFLEDVDGTIVDAYTTMHVFEGENAYSNEPSPGIMIVVDTEEGQEPISAFLKMGSAQNWVPNEDKTGLKYIGPQRIDGGQPGFSAKAKGMIFLTSLINCQFPESAITNNIKETLIGLKCHFESVVKEAKDKSIGKDGKYNVTIVTKIYELPPHAKNLSAGKGKKSKTSTTSKSSPTTSQASTPSKEDLDEYAATWLMAKLTDDTFAKKFPDGYIDKNKLAPLLMQDAEYDILMQDAGYDSNSGIRQKAAMRVFKEELLKKNIGWKFDANENRIYPAD